MWSITGRYYPIPTHLAGWLVSDPKRSDPKRLVGSLRCPCGGHSFELLYAAEKVENSEPRIKHLADAFLRTLEKDGNYFFRLSARCTECSRELVVFDADFHGWNGYVCGTDEQRSVPRPANAAWTCLHCGGAQHAISLMIDGEDRKTSLEEGEGVLTKDNWFNAFGWLTVDVTCTACGNGPSSIVSYEAM